jgi:hypothetical protein
MPKPRLRFAAGAARGGLTVELALGAWIIDGHTRGLMVALFVVASAVGAAATGWFDGFGRVLIVGALVAAIVGCAAVATGADARSPRLPECLGVNEIGLRGPCHKSLLEQSTSGSLLMIEIIVVGGAASITARSRRRPDAPMPGGARAST